MELTEHDALFERIDKIETLDDFVNWVRDLSAFAEADADIQNPATPLYLECLSAFMDASKHMTPLEVSEGSISFKSMARALMSALSYE
jgi:hypothetical protein